MLTERELILFKEALYWCWKYDECAPDDVGYGPTRRMLLSLICMRTNINITKEEEKQILGE